MKEPVQGLRARRQAGAEHLPRVGQASQRLLEGYGPRLLAALRREKGTAPLATKVEKAARALGNVLHARELGERLTARADVLAAQAEATAEVNIRALFAALSSDQKTRTRLFPGGLASSLAPRGMAQVSEIKRLVAAASTHRSLSAETAATMARLAAAGQALSDRQASAEEAHAALVDLWTAELQQRRRFRAQCHEVYGALLALDPTRPAQAARLFKNVATKCALSKGLPSAPRITAGHHGRRVPTKPKGRAAKKRGQR